MKLQESTNYDLFQMTDFNRDVKKTRKLEISMKAHGWIPAYPAHVVKEGGKLKIKAGHHRFTVACKLGIPVVYVVCDDNASIHELEESTVKWDLEDYLTSYVRLGDKDYMVVKEYYDRTGIKLGASMAMLAGQCANSASNALPAFKSGEFTVKNTAHAECVADLVKSMKDAGIEWANTTLVVIALSRILMAGHADIPQMKRRIVKNPGMIQKQPNIIAYTEMFESVYNRSNKGAKIPLTFLTNETLRKRQTNFGQPL